MLPAIGSASSQTTTPLTVSRIASVAASIPGANRRDISVATLKKYQVVVDLMIEFLADDRDVTAITRADYLAFHDWLGERGTKEVTTNGYRRTLRAIWNRLKRHGYPVCDISGLTTEMPEPRPDGKAIGREMFLRLVNVASVRDAAMLWYALQGGFRRQTLPRLRVDQTRIWQSDAGDFRICSEIPAEKAGPPRLVFGGQEAALSTKLWLMTRRYPSPWLFNHLDSPDALSVNSVSSIWRIVRTRAGLGADDLNGGWHTLRHEFCQQRLSQFDIVTVSQWMNITPATVQLVYGVRSNDRLMDLYYGDEAADWGFSSTHKP